jgi:hypothetical protein
VLFLGTPVFDFIQEDQKIKNTKVEISGSHGGEDEDDCHLGCCAV